MVETKKIKIIFHGHFYQPPRENPWSEVIPRQNSAAPYHDWNHRITAECYTANTSSRRLDEAGAIVGIENNYRRLSFNMGPTLLKWMEKSAPHTYDRIVKADKESMELFNGHGSAIAQSYNHSILPLNDKEDARTQIRWGIIDFKYRFGRQPRGMWLPETAINDRIIDILLEEGIEYTILSPFQAHSIRPLNAKEWQPVKHGAPCDRPFLIKGKKGQLNVFFYDPQLASGISFSHYLQDADKLYSLVQDKANSVEGDLISVATDGEIYGHHEAFGDMCLASFFNKVDQSDELELTNWSKYLDENPPQWEVKLIKGEDHRGSSWSCHHGVSRWYKDCGCHTGGHEGWNQSWRSPLRHGLNRINNEMKKTYLREMKKYTDKDPLMIRDDYGSVLCGELPHQAFLDTHFDQEKVSNHGPEILKLLEGQKYSQFMLTSCGWFFSELSGIEPVQNLKFAARAIELYSPWSKKNLDQLFSHYLKRCQSNIPEKGNGWDIYTEEAKTDYIHISKTVAHYLYQELYNITEKEPSGNYRFTGLVIKRDDNELAHGKISMELENTMENFHLNFHLDKPAECNSIILKIQESEDSKVIEFPLKDIPKCTREGIFDHKRKEDLKNLKHFLLNSHQDLMNFYNDLQCILPEGDDITLNTLKTTRWLALTAQLEEINDNGLIAQSEEVFKRVSDLFHLGKEVDQYTLTLCSSIIANEVESFLRNKSPDHVNGLYRFAQILWNNKIQAVKPYTQNLVFFAFHKDPAPSWLQEYLANTDDKKGETLLIVTQRLAQIMNLNREILIDIDDLKTFISA